jgi:TonB family protein
MDKVHTSCVGRVIPQCGQSIMARRNLLAVLLPLFVAIGVNAADSSQTTTALVNGTKIRAPSSDPLHYPDQPRRLLLEGRVLVEIMVREDGRVVQRRVVESEVDTRSDVPSAVAQESRTRFERSALSISGGGVYSYREDKSTLRISIVFRLEPCGRVSHYAADHEVVICSRPVKAQMHE